MNRSAALFMNINAAKGLEDVMKTNLGPTGTIKMLVGGAGGAFLGFFEPPPWHNMPNRENDGWAEPRAPSGG